MFVCVPDVSAESSTHAPSRSLSSPPLHREPDPTSLVLFLSRGKLDNSELHLSSRLRQAGGSSHSSSVCQPQVDLENEQGSKAMSISVSDEWEWSGRRAQTTH